MDSLVFTCFMISSTLLGVLIGRIYGFWELKSKLEGKV